MVEINIAPPSPGMPQFCGKAVSRSMIVDTQGRDPSTSMDFKKGIFQQVEKSFFLSCPLGDTSILKTLGHPKSSQTVGVKKMDF